MLKQCALRARFARKCCGSCGGALRTSHGVAARALDLRRWFAELKTNSHVAAARALRHARSPQQVQQAQNTFARRHRESTISAEGSPSSSPKRERFYLLIDVLALMFPPLYKPRPSIHTCVVKCLGFADSWLLDFSASRVPICRFSDSRVLGRFLG